MKIKHKNKRSIFPKGLSFVLLLLSTSLLFFDSAHAYQKESLDVEFKNDFVVEPGRTEVFMNPGETVIKTVSVTNRSNKAISFFLSTEDFKGTDNPDNPVMLLGDDIGPYSLKNFLTPEVDKFSLEPGEKIFFDVKISVPTDSEPGGFYGALIIANNPDGNFESDSGNTAQGQTKVVSRIGSLFLVRVNGEVYESGELEDFKIIESKLFYTKRPDGFEILFRNKGSVHLVPYGQINIKNIFGKTIDSLSVDAYAALPESLRYRQVVWEDGVSMGRYKAELSLYKGYGDEYDKMTIAFWVIPWKILLIVLLTLFILSSLLYFLTTRFELKKKQ